MRNQFSPHNGYLLVERVKNNSEQSSTFTIPEHLRTNTKSLGTEVVRLVDGVGLDEEPIMPGQLLAVEATMLEEFSHDGQLYTLVKAQFVKGAFKNNT